MMAMSIALGLCLIPWAFAWFTMPYTHKIPMRSPWRPVTWLSGVAVLFGTTWLQAHILTTFQSAEFNRKYLPVVGIPECIGFVALLAYRVLHKQSGRNTGPDC
jgi:hypothetical protein